MPDDIDEPLPLPENPSTVAELLPHLPVPYDYCKQWACVFSQELADRLVEVQAANPEQFRVTPLAMTDGRYLIRGAILSEVPNGLYGGNFARLDASRFDEIALVPWADAVALLPQPDPVEP
jgi:hypothetical protein